jgi:glycopeptide antibiotics resistance protein
VFATYLLPVTTALYVFPILVLVVMLPVAFVSYRRRGRAGGWTTLVFYGFLFYLLAAFMQTVIPLPTDPTGYCMTRSYASDPQLRPFHFLEVVQRRGGGDWSLGGMLDNPALWSTGLNAILLLPLGFFARYLNGMRFLAATAVGFGTSLLFELTQLTGLWFIYPCAYRLFSVDDLLLNTAGASLGWLIAGPLARLLPELRPERDRRRYATRVTATRRLFALLTDVLGFAVLTGFVLGLVVLFGGQADAGLPVVAVLGLVWFWLVPSLTGSTVGKRAMLLRIERGDGRRAGPFALLVRYGVLLSPLWLLWVGFSVQDWDFFGEPVQLLIPLGAVLSLLVVGIWTPLAVLFGGESGPHERLSRTVNVAIVPEEEPVAEQTATR